MKPNAHNANRSRRPRRVNNNNRRNQNNQNPNKHWESLGPNVRIRGSASQIYDKYVALAGDAKRNGDRVLVQNLMQHAEHYLRIMNQQQQQHQARQQTQESAQIELEANDETLENEEEANEDNDANEKPLLNGSSTLNAKNNRKKDSNTADIGAADSTDGDGDDGVIVEDLTPKPTILTNTEADDIV